MVDEHRPGDRGPVDGGNGGPVTPGAQPAPGGPQSAAGRAGHTGSNGATGGTAPHTVIRPGPTVTRAAVRGGAISGLWVGLTLSAVVLVFLLIFIVQNNVPVPIKFLGVEGTLSVGVALLFAAALGVLLVAIPGYGRILQLRRALRRRGLR